MIHDSAFLNYCYLCAMTSILHESQIFGPINLFSQYIGKEKLCIEKHEHYQKRSYRNRYSILTANGPVTLSIPLKKGKNAGTNITDVQISYDENWVEKHVHAIRSAYGKSPYFEFYFDDIEKILKKKHTSLFLLNMDSLYYVLKKLKLQIAVEYTDSYQKDYPDMTDLRNINWNLYQTQIKYMQVWEEKFNFTPNLSILDLLFCSGPESVYVLTKMNADGNLIALQNEI